MATSGQSLTVHEFSETNSRSSHSEGQLFAHAQRIIQSATVVSGWTWVDSDSTIDLESSNKNAFVYNKSPPAVSPHFRTRQKLWGSQLSDDEVYSLADLDEFIVSPKEAPQASNHSASLGPSYEFPTLTKRPRPFDEQSSSEQSSSKRRKVEFESIFKIIPQPHIHPSPYLPSLSDPKGRPFCKTTPTFILPYTDFSLDSDNRLAWLIPIRGAFPWPHCSSGQLVDFPMQAPLVEVNPVTWTRSILLGFWEYLLNLRRNAPIGALGIAFHPIKIANASSNSSSDLPRNGGDSQGRSTLAPHLPATPSECTLPRSNNRPSDSQPLWDIDYIKIYHDASRTFYVRSALDIWVYHPPESPMKIRPLKGARLPLVDDISQGILVS